jgi:hypothetical protein
MPNTIPGDPMKSLAQFGNFFEKRKQNKLKKEENDIAKEGVKAQEDRNNSYNKQNNLSNLRTNINNMYSENSAVAEHAVEEIFKTIDFYLEEYKNTGDIKHQTEAQDLLNKVCLYARNAGISNGANLHENDTCNAIAKQINTRLIAADKNDHDWESLVIDLRGAFFSKKVSIENIKSLENLKLNECKFQDGLSLRLAHSKNPSSKNSPLIHPPFTLSNCTFHGDLNIHGTQYSLSQEINITDNNFGDSSNLSISGLYASENTGLPINITGGSMPASMFFNCIHSPSIQIGSHNHKNGVIEIRGSINIENCENADFSMTENHTINGDLNIKPGSAPGTYEAHTAGNISLLSNQVMGRIMIGSPTERYQKIQEIRILKSDIHNGLYIHAEEINDIIFEYVNFLIGGKALKNSNDVQSVNFFNSTEIEFYNIRKIGKLHLHQVNFYAPLRIDATEIDKFHLSITNFYVIKPHVVWGTHSEEYCISCFRVTFNSDTKTNHAVSVVSHQSGYKLDS